jgi:hypothetical protein
LILLLVCFYFILYFKSIVYTRMYLFFSEFHQRLESDGVLKEPFEFCDHFSVLWEAPPCFVPLDEEVDADEQHEASMGALTVEDAIIWACGHPMENEDQFNLLDLLPITPLGSLPFKVQEQYSRKLFVARQGIVVPFMGPRGLRVRSFQLVRVWPVVWVLRASLPLQIRRIRDAHENLGETPSDTRSSNDLCNLVNGRDSEGTLCMRDALGFSLHAR